MTTPDPTSAPPPASGSSDSPPSTPPDQPDGTSPPSTGDEPLGEAGVRALERLKQELAQAKAQVKELSPLAQQAREAAEAQKTAEQRAAEAAAAATARAEAAERELMRTRIGSELALPPLLLERLTGSTEDELRADAARLKELWDGRPTPPPTPPSGAGDAGASGTPAGVTMNDLLRSAVRGR